MAKQSGIILEHFNEGGIADSDYSGYGNSVAAMVGFDLHSQPGLAKPNHRLVQISTGEDINEKIIKALACTDGITYCFSYESGKIWSVVRDSETGDWTVDLVYTTVADTGESACLGAIEFRGYIYWTTQNFLHRIAVGDTADWDTNAQPNWKQFTKEDAFLDIPPMVGVMDGVDDYFHAITNDDLDFTNDNIFTFSCYVKLNEGAMNKRNVIWGTRESLSDEFNIEVGQFSDGLVGVRVLTSGGTVVAHTGTVRVMAIRPRNGFIGRTADAVGSGQVTTEQTDSQVWNANRFLAGSNSAYQKIFDGEKWVHIVYVRTATGDNHHIYINGVEQNLAVTAAGNFTDGNSDKYIGARHDDTNFTEDAFFDGSIANIQFFDSAFNEAAVQALYNYNSIGSATVKASFLEDSSVVSPENGAYFEYDYDWERFHLRGALLEDSVVEADTHRKYFMVQQSPIRYINLWIADIGTGDWTVEIHDDEDTVLATATVVNTSLAVGLNQIELEDFEPNPGVWYHIHVYDDEGEGALMSRTIQAVQDARIEIFGEGDSTLHPMIEQNRVLYIGDRNNIHQVSVINGIHGLILSALDLPVPYHVSALGRFETHLVVGANLPGGVSNTRVFRWDTSSVSWISSDDIDEDGINAFIPADNELYVSVGKKGGIYFYDGVKLRKVKRVKGNYSPTATATVWPNAVATYKELPMFGVSNVSGDPALQGVYSFGHFSEAYPRILNLEYPISDEPIVTEGVEVTALAVYGGRFVVCWYNQETEEAGVSVVSDDEYINGAYIESRIFTYDRANKKAWGNIDVGYRMLPAGSSISIETSNNHANYQEIQTVNDELRKIVSSKETLEACTLQLKIVAYGGDPEEAPELESISIKLRGDTR